MESTGQLLSEYFPWDESRLAGKFVLCLDSNALSAEFAFTGLLFKALKAGLPVQLLSTKYSKSHYESILRKNGFDLRKLEAENGIDIVQLQSVTQLAAACATSSAIDKACLKQIDINKSEKSSYTANYIEHLYTLGEHSESGTPLANESSSLPYSVSTLRELYEGMTEGCWQYPLSKRKGNENSELKENNGQQYFLMIDDIDALELFAGDSSICRRFMSKMYASISKNSEKINRGDIQGVQSLVCFGRTDFDYGFGDDLTKTSEWSASLVHGMSDEVEEASLVEYCRYRADVTVEASTLASGYSSDVHGILTVTSNSTPESLKQRMVSRIHAPGSQPSASSGQSSSAIDSLWQQTLTYKALDSGVRCHTLK